MVGTSWISWCWSNSLVNFLYHSLGTQIFVSGITPNFLTDFFVQIFGKCFRKSVRQCFHHNRIVIIQILFEFGCPFVNSKTGSDTKRTHIIRFSAVFRSNKIRQSDVWSSFCLLRLLTQSQEFLQHFPVFIT